MVRTSLAFFAVAALCLFFADLEVTSLDPWHETALLLKGAVTPDLGVLIELRHAFFDTVVFALCSLFASVVIGTALAFFYRITFVRLFCSFIRSIHELFWALMLIPFFGLNPICGVLAIAIPYTGVIAKVFAEMYEESDRSGACGVPVGADRVGWFLYGVLPGLSEEAWHYTKYRFECALRSSAILGFVGLPTLGFYLETYFREGMYSEAAALLYGFFIIIASLKYWVKVRFMLVYVAFAFYHLSMELALSLENFVRTVTYEILPWPMRREGVLDGTYAVEMPGVEVWVWLKSIMVEEALPGIWETVVLTQIVLVGTALFALPGFAFVSRHFAGPVLRTLSHWVLIVMRTTPEYIIAYILVQVWGPSMLPAALAIILHNGAILSYLTGNNADLVRVRGASSARATDRYFYEVLPRVYGRFLAFLFYRWEIMMRESAILGLLGVYTLGFYLDSALHEDKLDKALVLILVVAALNMSIDAVSQRVRRGLRLSTKLVTSR